MGRATAVRLAADGHRVLVVGRRRPQLEETAAAAPGSIVPLPADLRTVAGAETVVEWVRAQPDPAVDVVVAAAGGRSAVPTDDASLEELATVWRDTLDLNLMTAVLLVEGLAPLLRKGAAVVLVSSTGVYHTGARPPYGAAKAALHGYVVALAHRLGADGVTVNAVVPGYVPDTEFFGGGLDPARHEALVAQTALGRAGTSEDIASLISWLANENRWTTAQMISPNGGTVAGR